MRCVRGSSVGLALVRAPLSFYVRRRSRTFNPMTTTVTIPPDDLRRNLAIAKPNEDQTLPHIGLAGDTYTILLTGADTGGSYCLIDMLVPPGGGPPPHRHDFEEMFSVLEGEIEVTFRGLRSILRAGETANIPANAPHHFRNVLQRPARLLCLCSPAGQENFFCQSGFRSRPERPHRPNSTKRHKTPSKQKPKPSLQSTGRSFYTLNCQ